jgi:hypothetical protein
VVGKKRLKEVFNEKKKVGKEKKESRVKHKKKGMEAE